MLLGSIGGTVMPGTVSLGSICVVTVTLIDWIKRKTFESEREGWVFL